MNNLTKDLSNMDERDLISEVLQLRKIIDDYDCTESKASQIHNYHFAGAELLKLTKKRYLGSGFIISITSLKGLPIIRPVTICDGFRDTTIDCLLDELQDTYDLKLNFKPIEKRLAR
jgi:hypothetical protein